MHARVVTARIASQDVDEAIRLWHETVAPSARQQPGFRNARFLVDRRTGAIASMGVWATEADLVASVGWNRGQLDRFAGLFTEEPVVGLYELVGDVLAPD